MHLMENICQKETSNFSSSVIQENQKKSQTCSFVSKVYDLLEIEEHASIVQWMPTGTSFIIHNVEEFENKILPKYFRHNRLQSFVRQLNMYGFHKSRKYSSKYIYSHPEFIKGRFDLLTQITRKNKKQENENKENIPKQLTVDTKSKYKHKKIQNNHSKISKKTLPSSLISTVTVCNQNEIPKNISLTSIVDCQDNQAKKQSKTFLPFSQVSFMSSGYIDPFGYEGYKLGKCSAFSVVELTEQDCIFEKKHQEQEQKNDDNLSICCQNEIQEELNIGRHPIITDQFLDENFF